MTYVYILQSVHATAQRYIGCTGELRGRLAEHNAGKSVHTAKFRPWLLVSYHAFADPEKAHAFERYLKSGSGRAFAQRHCQPQPGGGAQLSSEASHRKLRVLGTQVKGLNKSGGCAPLPNGRRQAFTFACRTGRRSRLTFISFRAFTPLRSAISVARVSYPGAFQ